MGGTVEAVLATIGGGSEIMRCVGHTLVDALDGLLQRGLFAHNVKEGGQCFSARSQRLSALFVLHGALGPVFGAVFLQETVRGVAQHIGVGHAAATAPAGIGGIRHTVA